ncbi:MAG: hypothetical protein ABI628_02295 [Chloroflexota bacterium]
MGVPRRGALWLAAMALSLAATIAGAAGPVDAADPADNPLDGPFVDVAAIAGTDGRAVAPGPPRLLAVRPPDVAAPGTVHVVLLGPDGGRWTVLALADIATELAHAGPARLVPVDDGFALVTVDAVAERTFVQLLWPGAAAITGGASVQTTLGEGGAGAADVDGDGNPELVLTGRSSLLRPANCGGSLLEVLDGHSLAPRLTVRLAGLDLAGGAIGRLGGGGEDLIAYARTPCRAAPEPGGDPLVVVDLRIGSSRIVLDRVRTAAPSPAVGPWIPHVADLDGDGVDEAIVRQGDRVLVLDAARGWRAEVLATNAIPLGVTRDHGRSNVVALYRPDIVLGDPRIDLVGIVGRSPTPESSIPVDRPRTTSVSLPEVELATDPGSPPPAWIGDLDGSGCLDVVVPRATFRRCPGESSAWASRTGPAWTMTAPLAAYDSAGGRRLLVAGGLAWSTGSGSLAVPAPLAAAPVAGGWRSAPSAPFVLEELDAVDIGYFGTYPRPIVDIDPSVIDRAGPGMILGGTGGDRVFVRLVPEGPLDATRPLAATSGSGGDDAVVAGRYLVTPPAPGFERVAFLPVTPARTAGANRGSVWVPLPQGGDPAASVSTPGSGDPRGPATETLAAAWRVEALGLNGFGEVSEISLGRVAVDRAGPNVSVDAPFLSAPWPFSAPIRGTTERGSRVRIGGGPFVETASNGAFVLRAQLAPWPQDLVIEAIDDHGNVSSQALSVVGGVDYRRLPWQAVVITAVLLGAAITTWRGPAGLRRNETARAAAGAYAGGSGVILDGATVRASPSGRVGAGVEEKGEIEDLPPPRRPPRG